jgi:hypothetical protein
MRKSSFSWLSGIAYAAAVEVLMRLIGLLLEVPSAPFDFREGGKTLAGWILLFFISVLAVEALLSLRRWWCRPPAPAPSSDPYLRAVAEMEKERADLARSGGKSRP